MPLETISSATYRRYILGKQGLWPGRRWAGHKGTALALANVEAVQIDPVTVVAQSHDIVLYGRVIDYQPEQLRELLYTERRFFDYGGGLMIYPMAELPYWRLVMARKKQEKRWVDFAAAQPELIERMRNEVAVRGPLRIRDIEGTRVSNYRAGKDTGVALYYLWLTGELMTHSRQGKERVYDLLSNVAPAHLQQAAPPPEAEAFFARKVVSLSGFVTARTFRSGWQRLIERRVNAREANAKLAELVAAHLLATVYVTGQKEPLYHLAADQHLLAELEENRVPAAWQPRDASTVDEVTFLSPLEYVSARGRAAKLFDFDYIWEIYKPAHMRQYGPYTMPILYKDRLAARMDAKVDRASQTLIVNGFWLEPWLEPDAPFRAALERGLGRFMRFLQVEQLDVEQVDLWILD